LEDLGVDGRIILKWIFDSWMGGIDWIDLAQDRDRWWAVANNFNGVKIYVLAIDIS
jgi:hypothetical protein